MPVFASVRVAIACQIDWSSFCFSMLGSAAAASRYVAKVPWLYNADAKEWITYEDAVSMRIKGAYVVEQGLAGAMFWELSNDDGTLLDALRTGLSK